MMYSAYNLNKQGDNLQPWCTPFPIWNQSVVPCPVLTVASWPAYRFLKRWVRFVCLACTKGYLWLNTHNKIHFSASDATEFLFSMPPFRSIRTSGKWSFSKLCFVIVQSLSHVWLFVTPWTAACQASLSFAISLSLLKLMSFGSVMHPTISSSVSSSSSCPHCFPASRSFMSQLFTSDG